MTLLSHDDLAELVNIGIIQHVKPEQINSSSIDVTLGKTIMVERSWAQMGNARKRISLRSRAALETSNCDISLPYDLYPGQFILGHTEQVFNLPCDISAEYKLKSSMARIGLEHLNAGWCDAGWNGSVLTLELKNMTVNHIIALQHGDAIGQVVFFKHKPVKYEDSYESRGRYNGDRTVSGIKE